MKRLAYIAFIVCCIVSCSEDNRCLKSLGDPATVVDYLALPFDKIRVEDRIKMRLIQDSSQAGKIILHGPENLLSSIGRDVKDGELTLTNNNTCNFLRSFDYSLDVDVYISTLSMLKVESIAEVTIKETLAFDRLEIYHNALSDIELNVNGREIFVQSRNSASTILHGRLRSLKASIEDVSNLDAKGVACDEVFLDSHTPIVCTMNATKGYYLNIYNTGNIEQYGRATDYEIVNKQLSTGTVVQK
jgi:hypothetical protein